MIVYILILPLGFLPDMVDGHVSSDGVEPCAERGSSGEARLSDTQFLRRYLPRALRDVNVSNETAEVEDQSIFAVSYYLYETFFVTIKETAGATCTIIH